MVGAYLPCAAFIRLSRRSDLTSIFLNVSFVGSESLAKDLGAEGEGVIVTQTVPHYESNLPIARSYREAMHQFSPKLSLTFGSMEGYISTRFLLAALEKRKSPIHRESVISALETAGEIDLGLGEELELSSTRHQASHRVWPTIIRAGKVVPFAWDELKRDGGHGE